MYAKRVKVLTEAIFEKSAVLIFAGNIKNPEFYVLSPDEVKITFSPEHISSQVEIQNCRLGSKLKFSYKNDRGKPIEVVSKTPVAAILYTA